MDNISIEKNLIKHLLIILMRVIFDQKNYKQVKQSCRQNMSRQITSTTKSLHRSPNYMLISLDELQKG